MTYEQFQQMTPQELYDYQKKNRETMQTRREKTRKSREYLHKYIEIGKLVSQDLYPGGLDLSQDESELTQQLIQLIYGKNS